MDVRGIFIDKMHYCFVFVVLRFNYLKKLPFFLNFNIEKLKNVFFKCNYLFFDGLE